MYTVLVQSHGAVTTSVIPSSQLRVGDLLLLSRDSRIPADVLLLRTSDPIGSCFIRTDQLDGETDWKLRVAVGMTQSKESNESVVAFKGEMWAEGPRLDIYAFDGTIKDLDTLTGTNSIVKVM